MCELCFAYCGVITASFQIKMAQAVKPRSRKASFTDVEIRTLINLFSQKKATDVEIRTLINLFSQKKAILLQKINSTSTNHLYKKMWAEITESVNS